MEKILGFVISSAAVSNFVIGLIVIKRNYKSITNAALSIFALLTAVWTASNFALLFAPSLALLRVAYGLGPLVMAAYLSWILAFCYGKKRQIYISFAFGFLIFFLNLTPHMVKSLKQFSAAGSSIEYGSLFPLYALYMLVVLIISYQILFKTIKKERGFKKSQAIFVAIGALLFSTISVLVSFILPMINVNSFAMLDSPSSIFFVGFSAYAIVRHRLMDIRLLVLRSVAYTISLALVVAGYISLTVLIFSRLQSIINPIALNIITLFALVLTYNPLRRFIEQHTDRLFAKGHYNFNELLAKFGDITKKNSRSITSLTNKVMETLTAEMRISSTAFVLLNSPTATQVRTLGLKSKNKHLWNKPVKIATDQNQTIVYDELPEDSLNREILRKVDAEVLIPIKTEQEIEAILALGPKNSGDMYTAQDLNLLELIAPQIAIALENAKSFKEKEQRITELKAINKMFQHIEHFLDIDNLMQKIVDEVIMVTGAEGGSVMLLDKSGKNLTIKTARNLHPLISLNTKIKVGEGIAGTVAEMHKPLILNGFRDQRFKPYLKREDVVSAISVPMKAGDKLIGVLNVNRKKLRVEFTKENVNVMTAFAAQAAEAIVKAGYYHEIEKLSIKNDNQFKEFTKALAKTVDAKDPYTYGHSEAVTNYALEIAKEMGASQSQMRILEIGGRLHDIGKIGVAEHILNKPAGLTDEEYKQIQRHPEIGARILQNTSSLKSIRDLILYHHERFDGRGYPTNLRGKEIPLLARILAVADTFDAMTSHRAYRKALPRKVAVEEIRKNAGSQFDPDIVKVFLRVLDKKRFRVIKNTMQQDAFVAKVQGLNLKPTAE